MVFGINRALDVIGVSMSDQSNGFRIDAGDLPGEDILFGSTPAMLEVRDTIARVCDIDLPVLLRGETGTGKEVIARYVHTRSRLRDGPFVKLNCAAIPVHLLESELMGYEKGAFTGATDRKPGLIELAHGGTLFLDEIGDMALSLQTKLLHLLQDGRYTRIGGREDCHAQARIVCATHCDLEAAVRLRSFRSDRSIASTSSACSFLRSASARRTFRNSANISCGRWKRSTADRDYRSLSRRCTFCRSGIGRATFGTWKTGSYDT